MIKRRISVAQKVSFRIDEPPKWQKYKTFEKQLLVGALAYDSEIVDMWKAYGKNGIDAMGQLRPEFEAEKKPYENYFNTDKKDPKVYEYDRHYNKPFIPDLKVARDRIKPWRNILKEIAKEEDERVVKMSVNRTYYRQPRFTDNYIEPMHRHAPDISQSKYRKRTGIFPRIDKYRGAGSYTENMPNKMVSYAHESYPK